MNICLVTNEFPALTETFITTKALELSKRGHSVTVIKNQESNIVNASHVAMVKEANIRVLTYNAAQSKTGIAKAVVSHPLLLMRSPSGAAFKKTLKLQLQNSLLGKYPFDIIHFEFSGLGIVYLKALDGIKAKVVVSCRGTAEKVKPVTEPLRKDQLRYLFARVDAIHCVSNDMAATIQPYCTEPEKIFVNRPSVDPAVFKRSRPYDHTGTLQILTIGRFTFQKGYLIGLMAMRELKNSGIIFKWKIVGDGPLKEELIYHIHALGLEEYVELLGKKTRDEILQLYDTANVFLLPSVYEGIANVCLEAMSMEIPVVSTKSGGMEEVIVHRQNGFLCEIYNPASIAENIKLLAADSHLAKTTGMNARQTILENFTIKQQADVFEEQYAKIINQLKS